MGRLVMIWLMGWGGDDTLRGREGNDVLLGGTGNDSLFGETGNDSLDGGEGDDYLDPGNGVDSVVGGDGGDRLNLDFSTATSDTTITYTSTTGGSVSTGTTFSEIERLRVFAGSGNDTIDAPATVGVGYFNDGNEIYGGAGG